MDSWHYGSFSAECEIFLSSVRPSSVFDGCIFFFFFFAFQVPCMKYFLPVPVGHNKMSKRFSVKSELLKPMVLGCIHKCLLCKISFVTSHHEIVSCCEVCLCTCWLQWASGWRMFKTLFFVLQYLNKLLHLVCFSIQWIRESIRKNN